MSIGTLPNEIISQWIYKKQSKVCKRWRQIWYHKTTYLVYTSKNMKYKGYQVVPLGLLIKFKNMVHLELDFMNLALVNMRFDMRPLTLLTQLQSFIFNTQGMIQEGVLRSLTNLTRLRCYGEFTVPSSFKYLTKLQDLDITGKDDPKFSHMSHLTNLTFFPLLGKFPRC